MRRIIESAEPPRVQLLTERAFATLEKFLHVEAVSGVMLMLVAAVALIWANLPPPVDYAAVWQMPLTVGLGSWISSRTLQFWINDGLMTVFFLVIGMEIRREIHEGALSNLRQALLPVTAALGGVVAPALIYVLLVPQPAQLAGWAVPTATDVAFAVGVLALLGRSIPSSLRIVLLTLAIVDDLIAVVIIAVFYSGGLQYGGFLLSAVGCMLVIVLQRMGFGSAWAYVLPAAVIWSGLLLSGAHPTLAGVVLGLMTPVSSGHLRGYSADSQPPVVKVQSALHPWVAYGVMPLFALANAGVAIGGEAAPAGGSQITWAVAIALLAGKPIGVLASSALAVRMGWCRMPEGLTWGGILLVGLLAGIGFTMSIFIASLAFADPAFIDAAKQGVLMGSFGSAVLALCWGRYLVARQRPVVSGAA